MKKNVIRLTEGQLHNVIKESVKRIICESYNLSPYDKMIIKCIKEDGCEEQNLIGGMKWVSSTGNTEIVWSKADNMWEIKSVYNGGVSVKKYTGEELAKRLGLI